MFTSQLLHLGFVASLANTSLFVYHSGPTILYLFLYVDDIIITSNVHAQISNLVHAIISTFELKELGPLNYFLGIQITPTKFGLTLSQSKCAFNILHRFNMHNSKPTKTPCCLATSLTPTTGYLLTDPTTYRSMVGALQYLTFTRLDLAFSVHQLCQFMQSPTTTHLEAAKRVLRYVRDTLTHGVHLYHGPLTLSAFTMLIGKGIHLIGNLLLVSLCFWGLILSHGPLRSKPQFLGPPLKLSIVNWPL